MKQNAQWWKFAWWFEWLIHWKRKQTHDSCILSNVHPYQRLSETNEQAATTTTTNKYPSWLIKSEQLKGTHFFVVCVSCTFRAMARRHIKLHLVTCAFQSFHQSFHSVVPFGVIGAIVPFYSMMKSCGFITNMLLSVSSYLYVSMSPICLLVLLLLLLLMSRSASHWPAFFHTKTVFLVHYTRIDALAVRCFHWDNAVFRLF